jgi:hypothetical protein
MWKEKRKKFRRFIDLPGQTLLSTTWPEAFGKGSQRPFWIAVAKAAA